MKRKELEQSDFFKSDQTQQERAPVAPQPTRKKKAHEIRYPYKRQFVTHKPVVIPTGETNVEHNAKRRTIKLMAYDEQSCLNFRATVESPDVFKAHFQNKKTALAKLARVEPLILREFFRRIIRDYCGINITEEETAKAKKSISVGFDANAVIIESSYF